MNISHRDSKAPLFSRLARLPLGSVTAGGWIKTQLERNAAGMGGHMDELEPDMIRDPYIEKLTQEELDRRSRERGGSSLGGVRAGWYAEISGTYWTGLVQLAFTLNDPELIRKAERWVDAVLAHQEKDGYIGSYLPIDDRMEDYNAWGTNWALRALFSYYEATGRRDVLEACHRGLLWFVENWGSHRTAYAGPTLMEGMAVGYSLTGDKRLLDWAEGYMDWLEGHSPWPNSASALASGRFDFNSSHTVAYGEMIKHPALLYAVNGRLDYLEASLNGAEKVIGKGTQRTGAPVSNYEYLSPPGAAYETEYCNFATYANTYAWLAMATGDARWGDRIEKIVFNGAQGARRKDERAIAYMTSPNQLFATQTSGIYNQCDMQAYAPVYRVACCPTQSVRVLPEYVRSMCMTDRDGGLYFIGYGPCRIRDGGMTVDEQTEYPFDGAVRLTLRMNESARRTLHLRVPQWCGETTVRLNGELLALDAAPGRFAAIDRVWNDRDVLELAMEMPVNVVPVQCFDMPGPALLAVERGPLLFSLPVKEVWTGTAGSPLTPLPEGWSWYNVTPELAPPGQYDMSVRYGACPWNYIVRPDLAGDRRIRAEYRPGAGYPWERPPVVVKMPAYRAKYASPPYPCKTVNPYLNPMPADGPETMVELVPYGCTALRVSYFVTAESPQADQ